MADPIRVLVCDDSAFMRKAIPQLINSDPGLTVIDTARDGAEAVKKAVELRPDVITMDIEMPVLNGHEALKRIRRECAGHAGGPPAVLMCSSLTSEGSHHALQALREGASDVIAKDASFFSTKMDEMRDELVTKLKHIGQARRRKATAKPSASPSGTSTGAATPETRAMALGARRYSLVVIGSSTGGPPVLETIISALPADISCPVVIAQHMPPNFTKAMAERLNQASRLSVVHGEHHMEVRAGQVAVLPGGLHGRVKPLPNGAFRLDISSEPKSELFKPSCNELLSSAAASAGKQAVGVILTGIGDDGSRGVQAIRQAGGLCLAQDPHTSVVYGMPKAAALAGATSMTPDQIAQTLSTLSASGAVAPGSSRAA